MLRLLLVKTLVISSNLIDTAFHGVVAQLVEQRKFLKRIIPRFFSKQNLKEFVATETVTSLPSRRFQVQVLTKCKNFVAQLVEHPHKKPVSTYSQILF